MLMEQIYKKGCICSKRDVREQIHGRVVLSAPGELLCRFFQDGWVLKILPIFGGGHAELALELIAQGAAADIGGRPPNSTSSELPVVQRCS